MENSFEQLEKINDMKKYLDFPPILNANKHLEELRPIDIKSGDIIEQYVAQDEKLKLLLELNNAYITSLNQRFIYLESVVTVLERQKRF